MPESSDIREVDGDNTSMFAKILDEIKEADKIMENKTTSVGQVILIESRDRESLFCLKPVHIETESSGNKNV